MFPLVDGGSTLGVSAVKINSSHIYLQCDPHSCIRPGLSCSLWLHCNVIESPTFSAVWGPWRECFFFFLGSFQIKAIWLLALQPLSLALSLTHAGANTAVCLEGCGVYRVMIKGLGEWHPQALKPPDWKWLWKHAHLSTCVQILVYMLHVCVNTDTLTAIRAPTAIHTEAFQLHHRSPGNHMELLRWNGRL